MNRTLKIGLLLFLMLLLLAYLFYAPLKEMAYAQLTEDMFVTVDDDSFDPGPAIGSRFPGLQADYQGRPITLVEEFAGANGTVVVASRSFVWCPYCMRQIVQLQEAKAAFEAAGIYIIAITYDTPAAQQAFAKKHNITIPLLADRHGLSFKTLGILNESYSPGDFQYGIAHPGMIIVDRDGTVVSKLFIEDYSVRIDASAALALSISALGLPPAP